MTERLALLSSRRRWWWLCSGAGLLFLSALVTAQRISPAVQPPVRVLPPGQVMQTAAPVAPLSRVTVPDVNVLGMLDGSGPNAGTWPRITNAGQKAWLQRLGKAFFWDMQVGSDGVQACATCHFHAGADGRIVNQLNPGTTAGDTVHDLTKLPAQLSIGANGELLRGHFNHIPRTGTAQVGLPVNEQVLTNTADLPDGTPGVMGPKPHPTLDANDVVGSQGIRRGTFSAVTGVGQEGGALSGTDAGFNVPFTTPAAGVPNTVRPSTGRNAPSVLNAVYNLRSFWDGRADLFFNGVSPLGFRDPNARVKTYVNGGLTAERLRIPFSSLASQAVGPPLNSVEMQLSGRTFPDIGRKLAQALPLRGQLVACDDSLLGVSSGLVDCTQQGTSNRGLTKTYGTLIRQVFDQRFWGDGAGQDVCLKATGEFVGTAAAGMCAATHGDSRYSLLEWNFALFFGLSVQGYEATLTTGQTIVDLVVGGMATGTVVNGSRSFNVTGQPLDACVAAVAHGGSAAAQQVATDVCASHYARFIHRDATSGSEAASTPFPVGRKVAIGAEGDCKVPTSSSCTSRPAGARTVLNVNRGLGRFFSGKTGCGLCHFNPEFTGATVSALTGFGAAPLPPQPPGQLRKEAPGVPLERMLTFSGAAGAYDSGFYNLGIRPTPEDVSLGGAVGGVPLAYTKLVDVVNGGSLEGYDRKAVDAVVRELATPGVLRIPTSPTNLTPRQFTLALGCGVGLVGGGNANNNPNANCVTTVQPGERLVRYGAFKTPSLRNLRFTGPYFHNGAKRDLRQVLETYKTAGHFTVLNFHNLAALAQFEQGLGTADEAALMELLETGLTDWRVAFDAERFDHPELCVPNGHDAVTGTTILRSIPAVGVAGHRDPLQTFAERLDGWTASRSHTLALTCSMPALAAKP